MYVNTHKILKIVYFSVCCMHRAFSTILKSSPIITMIDNLPIGALYIFNV